MNSSDYYTLYCDLWYESNPKEYNQNSEDSVNDLILPEDNQSDKIDLWNHKLYQIPTIK